MALKNAFADLATEPTLASVLTNLQSVLTELQGTLSVDVVGDVTIPTTDLRIERFGDGRVKYLATAPPGSAETDAVWTVKQFTYDGSLRLIAIDTATGAYSNRTNLTY